MGFLGFASAVSDRSTLDALKKVLQQQGYIERQTLLVNARHAGGDLELAAQLLDEMIRRLVDIFVAPGPANEPYASGMQAS